MSQVPDAYVCLQCIVRKHHILRICFLHLGSSEVLGVYYQPWKANQPCGPSLDVETAFSPNGDIERSPSLSATIQDRMLESLSGDELTAGAEINAPAAFSGNGAATDAPLD